MGRAGERCFPAPPLPWGAKAPRVIAIHHEARNTCDPVGEGNVIRQSEETYVTEMPADPGLNLEFVDEALNLVRDAEAKGIRLRILGSIAYRLQCPNNLHLFQDTKRVLTDVDFGAEKKQNRAIREFLTARGYVPDDGIYMASEGARHAYLHRQTGLNVDVFADELYFCHRIPFKDRLDLDMNRMLDQIQLLMESLSQVSNDIAHALRTPLGRLRQKLETARVTSGANSKCATIIDAALVETDNILDTFSALLRIAQIESGTRTAGFREIDLSKLFETVSEAFSAAAEDDGKTLTAKIAPSVKLWGDGDLISEMLANLIDNAIRHTPEGAHIEVSLVNHGSQLVARVADDGPGVPQSEYERIFRRFYRLERSIRTPGTGLGLSLVAAVAELHGMEFCASDNAPGLRMTITFDSASPSAPRRPRLPGRRAMESDMS